MSNLTSSKVHVFPFGSTRPTDLQGRSLNEQNITGMIKNLTDYSSYVVSRTTNSSSDVIEFVIQGYYFSADVSGVIVQESPLYASIKIDKDSQGCSYLSGNDAGEKLIPADNKLSKGQYLFTVEEIPHTLKLEYVPQSSDIGKSITIRGLNSNDYVNYKGNPIKPESLNDVSLNILDMSLVTLTLYFNDTNTKNTTISLTVVDEGEFTGVSFDITEPSDDSRHYLKLLDESGKVPAASYLKYNVSSLNIDTSNINQLVDTIVCGNADTLK